MGYCTQADILAQLSESELRQLTDDENAGAVAETVVSAAIVAADAAIDGYLGRRYAVPLSSVPPLITSFSADLALYHLYSRRAGTMPEERKDRYDSALRQLRDLSSGVMVLPGGEETLAATQNAAQIWTVSRVFGEDGFGGY